MEALQRFSIPLAIIVAGALVAGALYFGGSGGGSGAPGPGGAVAEVNVDDVRIDADDPFIGDEDAPVTLVYWSDYQCAFCKAVDVGGIPQIPIEPAIPVLIEEYVETGKLRIVFKDYAFLGPNSTMSALYKNAVWDLYPEHFYEWHEAMLTAQDPEHGSFGDEDSIVELARTIPGLDADRLKAQVAEKSEEYLARMISDQEEGARFGIQGTPGFITGTTLIPGADSPAAFKAAIDAQL